MYIKQIYLKMELIKHKKSKYINLRKYNKLMAKVVEK